VLSHFCPISNSSLYQISLGHSKDHTAHCIAGPLGLAESLSLNTSNILINAAHYYAGVAFYIGSLIHSGCDRLHRLRNTVYKKQEDFHPARFHYDANLRTYL
jgi:hypothetical protein